jgi:hypothetical protein
MDKFVIPTNLTYQKSHHKASRDEPYPTKRASDTDQLEGSPHDDDRAYSGHHFLSTWRGSFLAAQRFTQLPLKFGWHVHKEGGDY